MTDDLLKLLGGAQRGRTRVRGFAPWQPKQDTLLLLDQIRAVLVEYADYLPLTLRQIFYRLVGAHGYEKTDQAYGRLGECLNRARRARLIEMDVIRDGGGTRETPFFWDSGDQFLASMRRQAKTLRLDRSAGQPSLVVTCEAAGMVPQLARAVDEFGIEVVSSGGFESTTEKHGFAAALVDQDRPTEVLHIGDHDASGAHMVISLDEDVQAFTRDLGGQISFTRLAVTPAQIRPRARHNPEGLNLPTAPPKEGDKRAFVGDTCQAEAIAPDVLNRLLRNAVLARLDQSAFDKVLKRERATQQNLGRILREQS
jgi:hypothetical protein